MVGRTCARTDLTVKSTERSLVSLGRAWIQIEMEDPTPVQKCACTGWDHERRRRRLDERKLANHIPGPQLSHLPNLGFLPSALPPDLPLALPCFARRAR